MDPKYATTRLLEDVLASPLAKALLLGVLVLLLQIPVWLIHGLVDERDARRSEAVQEVSAKWGGTQAVVGPFLVIPYRALIDRVEADGSSTAQEVVRLATFLPSDLEIDGQLETEVRRRGIFEVPVYRSTLQIRGRFERPDFDWAQATSVDWDEAQLLVQIQDARGIDSHVRLDWGGSERAFRAGTGHRKSDQSGIHAPLEPFTADEIEFSTQLALRGSQQLRFAPLGLHTRVKLAGDWADPSFQGAWLPRSHAISANGFEATWEIPYLGRNFPQRWSGNENESAIAASVFGVDLIGPVGGYRATERSLKYQLLFLGLTFVVIWLVEVLGRVRVHPIQYALVGAALCLFYLLELSLSEHLGFALAYSLGALAIVSVVLFYVSAVLGRRRAVLVGALIAGLYGYLYVLLQIEDYALMVGSIGLFASLAAIMIATRGVDWYSLHAERRPSRDPTEGE